MINKGKVLSLRKINNKNFFYKNKFVLIMCLVFLCGVMLSVLLYGKKGSAVDFSNIINTYYIKRSSQKFFKTFFLSFLNFLSVLVLLFVFGTSVTGVGIIPACIFIVGYISGGISAYLYSVYSLKGIAFNALIVTPPTVVFIILCFFAAKASFEFSLCLSKVTLKRAAANTPVSFSIYCNKYLIYSGVCIFVSLTDTLISSLFLKIFKF